MINLLFYFVTESNSAVGRKNFRGFGSMVFIETSHPVL